MAAMTSLCACANPVVDTPPCYNTAIKFTTKISKPKTAPENVTTAPGKLEANMALSTGGLASGTNKTASKIIQ
jgi:hypothetical protein